MTATRSITTTAATTTIRGLATTYGCSIRETMANRRGFALQVSVMVVNDLVWLLFWLLFFDRFGSIRGWTLDDMIVLLAVLTTSVGTVLGLFGNARRIAVLVSDGTLDAALALPVPALPYLLVRHINVVFVGDMVYGIDLTPQRPNIYAVEYLYENCLPPVVLRCDDVRPTESVLTCLCSEPCEVLLTSHIGGTYRHWLCASEDVGSSFYVGCGSLCGEVHISVRFGPRHVYVDVLAVSRHTCFEAIDVKGRVLNVT